VAGRLPVQLAAPARAVVAAVGDAIYRETSSRSARVLLAALPPLNTTYGSFSREITHLTV